MQSIVIRKCCTESSQPLGLFGRHQATCSLTLMGKLNIAHHKSYHPYRRDNIERVRRDEEEARLKEENEEGRMMLAVRMNSLNFDL